MIKAKTKHLAGAISLLLVGGAYADNPNSSCDLNTVNAVANDCYTATIPLTTAAPTIDGVISPAEWDLAITKNLGARDFIGGSIVNIDTDHTIKMLRASELVGTEEKEFLYLLIEVNIPSTTANLEPEDSIDIFIDPNHNHDVGLDGEVPRGDEYWYRLRRDGVRFVDRNIRNQSGDPTVLWDVCNLGNVPGVGICSELYSQSVMGGNVTNSPVNYPVNSGVNSNWFVELRVAPQDLGYEEGLPTLPQLLGLAVRINGSSLNVIGSPVWPQNLYGDNDITHEELWANVKSRNPFAMALNIDYSTSMNGSISDSSDDSRLDGAKQAIDYLATFTAFMSDTRYFDDRIGVVGFTARNDVIDVRELKPLAQVPDAGDLPYAVFDDEYEDDERGTTPIAAGVNQVFSMLDMADTGDALDNHTKLGITLSDGYHNEVFTDFVVDGTIDPNDDENNRFDTLSYTPCNGLTPSNFDNQWDVSWLSANCETSEIAMHTVFLGRSRGDSGFERLSKLSRHYNGRVDGAGETEFLVTNSVAELKSMFIDTLKDIYRFDYVQNHIVSSPGTNIEIDGGNAKAIFIKSFADGFTPASFGMRFSESPNPGSDSNASLVNCDQLGTFPELGLQICTLNNPAGGNYQLTPAESDTTSELYALVDLILDVNLRLPGKVLYTDVPFQIEVAMNEAGLPLKPKGEVGVQSFAIIDRPDIDLNAEVAQRDRSCRLYDDGPVIIPQVVDTVKTFDLPMLEQIKENWTIKQENQLLNRQYAQLPAASDFAKDIIVRPPITRFNASNFYRVVDQRVTDCAKKEVDLLRRKMDIVELKYAGDGVWKSEEIVLPFSGAVTISHIVRGLNNKKQFFRRMGSKTVDIRQKISPQESELTSKVIDKGSINGRSFITTEFAFKPVTVSGKPFGLSASYPDLRLPLSGNVFDISDIMVDAKGNYYRKVSSWADEPAPKVTPVVQGKSTNNCEFTYTSKLKTWFGTYFTGLVRINNPTDEVVDGWEVSLAFDRGHDVTATWPAYMSGSNPYFFKPVTGLNERIFPQRFVDFGVTGFVNRGIDINEPVVGGDVCTSLSF